MEKLMPIVPGCMCLVVNSKNQINVGKQVQAVEIKRYENGEKVWSVKGDSLINGYGLPGWGSAYESWLMRIDGGEFEAEMFQESLEDLEWVKAERLKKQISSEK